MVRFFRDSGLPSRRSREAARRRRRSDRERDLKLESLEPRLALAVMPGLPDMIAPVVRSVTLPAAGTYGTDRALSFKVNFNEPVKVVGDQSAVTLPVEVGYAMHEARYVSGSGTRSLTFRMTVAANDVDTDGISLGRVNSAAVRDFDFAANQILDRAGNPASDVIPAVNTSRIRVDATGPVVASSGDFATKGQQVSLKVTFDGPVTVKGKPTIPVTIGGQDRSLAYAFGSGTKTLTFAVTLPRRASAANPAFRGENGLPGEVIVLPAGADLKDRFGNSVTAVGGNFGKTFTHSGSRVVVIGTHFEKLTFGESDSLSQDDLNTILNDEQLGFLNDGDAEYLKDYAPPVFRSAKNEVELYRVAYRSTIPEQGNRPTVAYGLVAIPKGGTGALPLVCYQHGELLLKESAPSQAFFWDKTDDTTPVRYGLTQKQLYDSAYETRLNVAQFAGNGYAVIAADSFGLGNSVELDSFLAKQSGQQANLDMHAASQKLLQSLALTADKLFLNGWSTGGLATIAFQEALEAKGVKIDGVSTAATPSDLEMFVNRMIFNPRPYSDTTVPDGPWNVAIPQLAAFSLGAYGRKPGAALELFGGNYDFARKFFMREFEALPEFTFRSVVGGDPTPVMTMDGVTRSAAPAQFIADRLGQDAGAFSRTAFAGLIRDAGVGSTGLASDMQTYYGLADEIVPESVATILDTRQAATFGKTNLELVPLDDASHRGTLLNAAYGQLRWFDIQRGAIPSGIVGSVNPVTGVPAAVENLVATPAGTGELLLEWSPSAGAAFYDVYVNGQKTITAGTPLWFFDKLDPRTSYTFSVVPKNASGSGPETKVVFGPATVVDMRESTPSNNVVGGQQRAMTTGLDGSLWVASRYTEDVTFLQQIVKNAAGTWTAQSPIWVENPIALTTGLDGSIWVAGMPTDQHPDQGTVQRIVQENGSWVRKEAITVDKWPRGITTGIDGTIFVVSRTSSDSSPAPGSVQRIVQDQNGNWFVQGEPIPVDQDPWAITAGPDGSIWVACKPGTNGGSVQRIVKFEDGAWNVLGAALTVDKDPWSLTTAADGSIWVGCRPHFDDGPGSLQRIVNENGQWFVKGSAISVDGTPYLLTAGPDGSIWTGSKSNGTVQQVVNERGTWFVQGDPINIGGVVGLTTGVDGSIWAVKGRQKSLFADQKMTVQLWTNPVPPTDLKVTPGPHEGMATLSWKAPAADGGTPVTSYTVTARQGATTRTFPNWSDTAYRVTGLDVSKGPVYFTVAANNFAGTSPVATLLMGQDGKPIDTTHLTTGITTDGTWILGDGFDTLGQTYSWEALGSGKPVPFGNVAFTFGLPNQPHTIIAKGQTIPVPQGDYGTVNLAGASVYYGAQPNLTFTLNYTDGTTGTWTQSVSDWAKPLNFPGEQAIALPYYNKNDATKGQHSVHLYGYSQTLEKGKTLASITLPNNPNVRFLDIQMGRSAPTTTGVVTDGTRFIGGLDGQGNAYSFEALGSGKAIPFGKVAFDVGAPNQPGAIAMAAQTIAVPQGNYRTINLAATAVNGPRQDRLFKLLFTDGSTDSWVQSISDWASPQNYAGETKIATMDYRNKGDGTKDGRPVYLYGYSRAIPAGKTLKSITLMQTDAKVKILDIAMGS
jgi:hypothetical protein